MEKVFKSQRLERMEITIGEAKPILREIEMEKHLNSDQITKDAILVINAAHVALLCVAVDCTRIYNKISVHWNERICSHVQSISM